MDELNKKLAEWAGFTCMYRGVAVEETGVEYWTCPPDSEKTIPLPNFTESLDACFKWLMPILRKMGCTVCLDILLESALVTIVRKAKMYEADVDKTALALCLAIEKLIDRSD